MRLYTRARKKQFDVVTIVPNVTGTYTACFSNEFSILKHRRVYMSFQVGEKSPPQLDENHTTVHAIESSLVKMRDKLEAAVDYQTQH